MKYLMVTRIFEFYNEEEELFYQMSFGPSEIEDEIVPMICDPSFTLYTYENSEKCEYIRDNYICIDTYEYLEYRSFNTALIYYQYKLRKK